MELVASKHAFEELQNSPKRTVVAVGQSWDSQADLAGLADSFLAPGTD